MNPTFPFSAFVGQERMLTGLLLNAVNPRIGGILIRGEKGTGKSTVVRALASLLPEIEVKEGCPFGCDPGEKAAACPHCGQLSPDEAPATVKRPTPVVDLPINATEDRVSGTMDMEHALTSGEKRFEPGLLARANRGILYVDEVNLLDDHIVDILLDSAAMGVNTVEREGMSVTHPARFILVGTMNPEEGDLRPQLLDRFGLCVAVKGIADLDQRDELLRRWEAFEANPTAFCGQWKKEEARLRKRIVQARKLLPRIKADAGIIRMITDLAVRMGVDGHRADLVILKTAKTHAAFRGNREVTEEDVALAAKFALYHRMRRQPFDEIPDDMGMVDRILSQPPEGGCHKKKLLRPEASKKTSEPAREREPVREARPPEGKPCDRLAGQGEWGQILEAGGMAELDLEEEKRRRSAKPRPEKGRLSPARALPKRGRYVRPTPAGGLLDLALDATFRAAAPFARSRPPSHLAIPILPQDWRDKIRTHKTGALFVFVVDASGSMGTHLMSLTKAAILQLLDKAYKDRSEAALVAFKARGAELLLPPTRSISLAEKCLRDLPTGGATPLAAGISLGHRVAERALAGIRHSWPHLVLVTDGRGNVGMDAARRGSGLMVLPLHEEVFAVARKVRKDTRIRSLVLDTEEKHPGNLDMAREIAMHMGARYVAMGNLQPGGMIRAIME
ncbi:MAG: magnesium chelatase subunit D family protein [Proteobacteria bacterium]|nr:magnesium chelatase subunit D family protein [Pseudomonadota bacterium]